MKRTEHPLDGTTVHRADPLQRARHRDELGFERKRVTAVAVGVTHVALGHVERFELAAVDRAWLTRPNQGAGVEVDTNAAVVSSVLTTSNASGSGGNAKAPEASSCL